MHFFAVKPYFLQEPEDVTASDGEDVGLDCEVGGDPEPTILWHREDGKLPEGRTKIQNGRLIIQDVAPLDEGVYVCEAQNAVGIISVSASLSVHGKATMFTMDLQSYIGCLCFSTPHVHCQTERPEGRDERDRQVRVSGWR